MKKLFGILLSSTLVLTLLVNAHAAATTRRSSYGYLGSATYYATADFVGSALVSGSGGMHAIGGTVSNVTCSEAGNSVTVSSKLSTPSNYGVPISKTVYSTSTIY